MIASILAARQTPLAELPLVISAIERGLHAISATAEPISRPAPPQSKSLPAKSLPAKPSMSKSVMPRPAVARVAAPKATVVRIPASEAPARRVKVARQVARPRRVEAEIIEDVAVPPPEPPQPKLLRRSDVLAHEQEHHHEQPSILRVPAGTVRGVVKWFDARAGKGVLRLAGVSGDVALEPAVLARSGIKRLYKDQEVEATVQEGGGRTQLITLTLPGRGAASALPNLAGEVTGTIRRQPRQVLVEVKRDGSRQRLARAEAEQLLGRSDGLKATGNSGH